MKYIFGLIAVLSLTQASAGVNLINGLPVGDQFKGVGTFDIGCTITKVGVHQFLTAAHCVSGREKRLNLKFRDFTGSVKVVSGHIHPSWTKDCEKIRCTGKEVGGPYMTPGRADVALFNVKEETPNVPVVPVNFSALNVGDQVAMVGAGCTRSVEPGGRGSMRYAITRLLSYEALIHEHSLYKDIAATTGESDWVTPGYGVSTDNASLCPGDSGGPLLSKNTAGEWLIVGIAADYTFNGPYRDGDVTVTNLHTRLDDDSHEHVGAWIRENWIE